MSEQQENQGEGDKEAAKKYNQEQQEFVQSAEGKKQIDKAGEIDAGAEDLHEAAEEGKARAKEEDPYIEREHS